MASFCMRVDVIGMLMRGKKAYQGMASHDNGQPMTTKETKHYLLTELAQGHRFLPMGDCDNWDEVNGKCLGHEEGKEAPNA